MTNVVLSCISVVRAFWIRCSVSVSTLEVESSNTRILGFISNARAMAIRCFSPPERVTPRSPTLVSYPFGSDAIKSCIFAALATSIICSMLASVLPYDILSFIEAAKRNVSWRTMLNCFLSDSKVTSLISIPSMIILPEVGS